MSTFPSSNRKRLRSSSDTNKSFMQSVSEKVSGLIPVRISKWFSSSKSVDQNGTMSAAEIADSFTDDEEEDISPQPMPAKRMRFTSGQHSHFNPADANRASISVDVIEPPSVPQNPLQSLPITSIFRHESNYVSSPVRSITEESSMGTNEPDDSKKFKIQHNINSIRKSVVTKREPISKSFKTNSTKATLPLNKGQGVKRSFKPSLLSSPFYSGSTMYGGASCSNMNQANIVEKKVAVVKESKVDDTVIMSYSARTILDLLENYSSPLTEARRSSLYVKSSSPTTNISTGSTSQENKDAYRTQDLYVPHMASVMRLKRKSRLMESTKLARELIASHSSTIGVDPYPKHTVPKQKEDEQELDKIKNKGSDKCNEGDFPQVESPNNLPNSTTKTTNPAVLKNFTTSTPINKKILNSRDMANKSNHSSELVFKFSNPEPVSDLPKTSTITSNQIGATGHGKQNLESISHTNDEQQNVIISPNVKKDLILTNMLQEWKCSDCWINNKPDVDNCIACGGKRPAVIADKPVKCAMCNIADAQKHIGKCINCENIEMKKTDTTKSKEIVTWKCNECWVNNEDTVEKCVCCGSTKLNKSNTVITKTSLNTIGTNWKCGGHSTWNEGSLEKFGTDSVKITSKVNNDSEVVNVLADNDDANSLLSSKKQTVDAFADIVKSQNSDTWECSSCLIKNTNEITTCMCCGAEKDNMNKTAENRIQFNFDTNVSAKFKFGIFPNEPQEPDIVDNVMEDDSLPEIPKSMETVANNNILTEMPTFSNNDYRSKLDFSKYMEDESTKDKFNLPTSLPTLINIQAPSLTGNSNIEKEKPQNVPKINFGYSESNKQKQFFEFFTSKTENVDTPQAIPFIGSSLSVHDKNSSKDYLSLPGYSSPAVTTAPQLSTTPNTFRFSASKLNLSSNPFESPASTIATTTLTFAIPSQTISNSTVTSPIALFSKSETNTNNTPSLFSKKDDDTTTGRSLFQTNEPVVGTTQTAVTAAPIFSFGSNTQTSAPQASAEKSKFNFVFLGNTSENTTLFKPAPFGTMPESNAGPHKFTLQPGNTLSGGTGGLFGNTLSGNTLTTTSSLVGSADGSVNTNAAVNGLQTNTPVTGVFGTSDQKENLWSSNNNTPNNMFVPNTTASTLQKPAPFAFGTPTPFNASAPSFANNPQTTQNMFGIPSHTTGTQPAMFSNPAQNQTVGTQPGMFSNPAQNQTTGVQPVMFSNPTQNQTTGTQPGMFSNPAQNQTAGAQPAMFSNPTQNQTTPNIFGNTATVNNQAPSLANMFGTHNVAAAATFGSPNTSITTFEAATINPAPTPAFNFGGAPATNVMNFGQQQTTQPAGVYNFGGNAAGPPQVQFSIGTSPNTAVRRVRKAVRRNPQR